MIPSCPPDYSCVLSWQQVPVARTLAEQTTFVWGLIGLALVLVVLIVAYAWNTRGKS